MNSEELVKKIYDVSREMGSLIDTGSENKDIRITRYWGGKKVGTCLQLESNTGFIQVSEKDWKEIKKCFK